MIASWSLAAILALGAPLAPMTAAAQAQRPLTFDAASVKPATVPDGVTVTGNSMTTRKGAGISIPRNTGGPGTDDPVRIRYPLISLKSLLGRAYDSYFEIQGPGWLDDNFVQVEATMPPDTTKAQFQEMLRSLITDRFQLKHHTETKEINGYALVVIRNGPKMKESVMAAASPEQDDSTPRAPRQIGPDGFPIVPPRAGPFSMLQGMAGERARMVCQQQTTQDLANTLGRSLQTVVKDMTGLKAKYDFTVTYAGHLGSGGMEASQPSDLPDIFSALQARLGLKLEPKKVPVEVFVVDHMEKTPAGN